MAQTDKQAGPGEAEPEGAPPEHVATVAVAEERLVVGKHVRPTGQVTVEITPTTREKTVSLTSVTEHAEVERVPVHRVVETAPPVRQEGDTTIIPIMEEELVIQKRLVVREEIHITRRREARSREERARLRSEQAEVRRRGSSER